MNDFLFYEVKDANKTIITFTFEIEYKRDDIIKKKLMQRMLFNYTNNLKSIKEHAKKKEELYIMGFNCNILADEDIAIYDISFTMPKSNILKDFSLDNAVKFIYDTLFNPFVNNGQFDLETFDMELDYLKCLEKDYPHSIYEYASDKFLDFVDEENKTMLHHDEYLGYLNSVNSEDVYKYYLKNIKNNDFIVRVFGNIEEKTKILDTINKYFKTNKVSKNEFIFYSPLPILEYKEKNITTKYSQTVLSLLYQFSNLKKEDLIKLDMLYFFLNSKENDLLYEELRYKNNLVYQAETKYYNYYGALSINIFLDYKLLDKVEATINNMFNNLKNKDNYELYKSRLTKAIEYDILNSEDYPFYIVRKTFYEKYLKDDLFEVKLEKIKNILFEEFREFLDSMVLTRKMIMKSGDTND